MKETMVETEISMELNTGVFQEMGNGSHEMVMFCKDNDSGLQAIIAVHNTTLGPGVGGVRMWPYHTEQDALTDALRLSRGMTYKNALAGLNFGGGKAVIIGDSRKDKTEALLRRFGRFVNNLGGKYYTAEDVGMNEDDMELVGMETPYVTGKSRLLGGSGDPSVVTAYGTYIGIKAALKYVTGSESLSGKKVTIQGVGAVGADLARRLAKEGAQLFIYDIFQDQLEEVAKDTGAKILSSDEVYSHPVDIFSPCALGGVMNEHSIQQLNCKIIAGAANNQLLHESQDGQRLTQRGILYAPDFAINAGGIINISVEYEENAYNPDRAMHKAERIYDTLLKIFNIATEKNITTHEAAVWLAEDRIERLSKNFRFI